MTNMKLQITSKNSWIKTGLFISNRKHTDNLLRDNLGSDKQNVFTNWSPDWGWRTRCDLFVTVCCWRRKEKCSWCLWGIHLLTPDSSDKVFVLPTIQTAGQWEYIPQRGEGERNMLVVQVWSAEGGGEQVAGWSLELQCRRNTKSPSGRKISILRNWGLALLSRIIEFYWVTQLFIRLSDQSI